MSQNAASPSDLQVQQGIRVAIAATGRGDYAGALRVFKVVYDVPGSKAPPDGLSAYGLCVALEEKQTKKGVDLCRAAIAAQFYDARHYCNLIELHLKKGNRRAAVEVLREALGRLPQDSELLAFRESLGIEQRTPIRFLSRTNPINRMLSRGRRRRSMPNERRGTFRGMSLHPVLVGVLVLVFFAAVFGGTFFVLYRQAYG